MKTKTITYNHSHNYGAVLQSYALQKTLGDLGIENQIIDYIAHENHIFVEIKSCNLKDVIKKIIKNILTSFYFIQLKKRYVRFENFINEELNLTQKYYTYDELKKNPPLADCYITGSDQVWNITNGINRAFFLDFGYKQTRRISYAASMGKNFVPMIYKEEFLDLLNKFNKISVRESEAKEVIQANIAKKVDVVIDPVFLVEREYWEEMSLDNECDKILGKYILCYQLSYHPLLNQSLKKLKELTGYKILVITTNNRTKLEADKVIRNAGPKEFLSYFRNAEYVLTTSFHGTAFSIIFQKTFYAFLPANTSSRITQLLEKFNLSDRIVKQVDQINSKRLNYSNSIEVINKEREKALKYLKHAILGEDDE